MDFKRWVQLVRQAGASTSQVNPLWLDEQFKSGASPATVAQYLKQNPPPKNPGNDGFGNAGFVVTFVVALLICAGIISAFASKGAYANSPKVEITWTYIGPNFANFVLKNTHTKPVGNFKLWLPATETRRDDGFESTVQGKAYSTKIWIIEPGKSGVGQFKIGGIDKYTIPMVENDGEDFILVPSQQ